MRLLDELKEFLQRKNVLAKDRTGAPADLEVQAATALVLLEAAHGDESYEWREHRAIVQGLERAFGLGKAEVRKLLQRSEEIRPPRVRLSDVTQVIRDRFEPAQRREVLRLLWQVVDADGFVEEWERSFAAHIARAVDVPDEEVTAARQESRTR